MLRYCFDSKLTNWRETQYRRFNLVWNNKTENKIRNKTENKIENKIESKIGSKTESKTENKTKSTGLYRCCSPSSRIWYSLSSTEQDSVYFLSPSFIEQLFCDVLSLFYNNLRRSLAFLLYNILFGFRFSSITNLNTI